MVVHRSYPCNFSPFSAAGTPNTPVISVLTTWTFPSLADRLPPNFPPLMSSSFLFYNTIFSSRIPIFGNHIELDALQLHVQSLSDELNFRVI
jgi:hypothetical protein